ncbi:MAG: site-2 protease family protein [Burkholderiales bacterium]|jgi:Zn-dependent protease/CBS domain-containing protein
MFGGIRLGRIAGLEVILDWSLLIVFSLILVSLGVGVFPAWHPDWSTMLAWTIAAAAAILFFVSILLHEMSHALVGRAVGIRIPRITLFMFGGMAQMEGEPPSWRAELVMALIGPVTSLILGVVFLTLAGSLAGGIELDPEHPREALALLGPVPTLLMWLGQINILLAIFNLVPGFPLDGGRALRALLWGLTGDLQRATRWASRGGQAFAWLLTGIGIAMMLGIPVPPFGRGLVSGLWLVFIGWFLNNAATMGYRQLVVRDALEDVPVSRLMLKKITMVDPGESVHDLIEQQLMPSGQRAFPVTENTRLVGLVSLQDLNRVPRDHWSQTAIKTIMTPRSRLTTVAPHDSAGNALSLLARQNLNQLPVVDGEHVVGMLRREDIIKWLSLQADAHPGGTGLSAKD